MKTNRSQYEQQHYLENREKLRKQQAEYYLKHRERLLKKHRKYNNDNPDKIRNNKNRPKARFTAYQGNARVRNILFNLTFEQFMTFWQKPCWYCNDPVKTIGLDRIDNSKGYELNNIVPCCTIHNKGKLTLTQEDFIISCNKVAKLHPRSIV